MGDNGRKNQTNGDYIRVQDPHLNSFLTPSFWFFGGSFVFFYRERERDLGGICYDIVILDIKNLREIHVYQLVLGSHET